MLNVNAVAPDWNLKLFDEMMEKLTNEECSRTRLEFKAGTPKGTTDHDRKCSRTRLEFKGPSQPVRSLPVCQCSRTRLEFKGALIMVRHSPLNECSRTRLEFKVVSIGSSVFKRFNAVAPDWNLKSGP